MDREEAENWTLWEASREGQGGHLGDAEQCPGEGITGFEGW